MIHTVAFFEPITTGADEPVNAVEDTIMNTINNRIQPGMDVGLAWVYASSLTITDARLDTPKARAVVLPWFANLNGALLPVSDPNFNDYSANPFDIRGLEELQPQVSTTAIFPENVYVVMGLEDGRVPVPAGDVYTIRGVTAGGATAGEWSTVNVVWDQLIPAGRYGIVGFTVESVTGIAYRFAISGQDFRPGGISVSLVTDRSAEIFLSQDLGILGTFDGWNMPRLQVLDDVASATHQVLLRFVRLG